MAFQTSNAIDFATYSPPPSLPDAQVSNGSVTTMNPVLTSASFGDPLSMPSVAWVSSPGSDVSIGLSSPGGVQVVRYTYNAIPHGATLTLRSERGQTGPVAAWVGPDATTYVTYTDQAKGSGTTVSTKRYFMRIESPATLP